MSTYMRFKSAAEERTMQSDSAFAWQITWTTINHSFCCRNFEGSHTTSFMSRKKAFD